MYAGNVRNENGVKKAPLEFKTWAPRRVLCFVAAELKGRCDVNSAQNATATLSLGKWTTCVNNGDLCLPNNASGDKLSDNRSLLMGLLKYCNLPLNIVTVIAGVSPCI